MTQTSTNKDGNGLAAGIISQLPMDRLKQEAQEFGSALAQHGFSKASGGVESFTNRLNDYANGSAVPKMAKNIAEGDSPVKAGVKATAAKAKDAVKEKLGGGGGGKGQKLKVTNIVEAIEVPVPRDVAYQQWTQFEDFPTFMKKVESVKQEEDQKLTWKAQILWSHRSWEATIVDQVPNERIVWKSEGEKGHVDGAVTFHELAPDLTHIVVTLEYHPKGFFEQTGNLWRAQGRRVRLELKHFRRHVANQTLLQQDEVDGWEGEIHDSEVSKSPAKKSSGGGRARKSSAHKKSTSSRSSGRKSTTSRSSGRKSTTSKRTPAKKTAAAKSASPRKGTAKKTTSGTRSAKKSSTASKSAAKKTTRKAPAKKTAAKKTAAKKTAAKKTAAKRSSARKTTGKRTSGSARSGR